MTIVFRMMVLVWVSFGASALTFNVNVLTDGVDVNLGDSVCEMTSGMGDCSLRAAVNEANQLGGSHIIILGAGQHDLSIAGVENAGFAGDLDVTGADISIIGLGADLTTIEGGSLDRVFQISNDGEFSLSQLTVTGGRASTSGNFSGGGLSAGGALVTVSVQDVNFIANSANAGGGIYASGANLIITNSYFKNNLTENLGFTNLNGPAIYCSSCVLSIDSSTFTQNDQGGKAIELHGASLHMTNSTVSDNEGGGIRTSNSNGVIRFSTFYSAGGQNVSHYSFDDSHVLSIGGSAMLISADSFTTNCQSGDKPVSLGYNILNDDSCEFTDSGDIQNTTLNLSTLSDNGGPTDTHLPLTGSPLIGHVPLMDCVDAQGTSLSSDQRGILRPLGQLCDVGAVESDIIFDHGFE